MTQDQSNKLDEIYNIAQDLHNLPTMDFVSVTRGGSDWSYSDIKTVGKDGIAYIYAGGVGNQSLTVHVYKNDTEVFTRVIGGASVAGTTDGTIEVKKGDSLKGKVDSTGACWLYYLYIVFPR